MIAIINGCGSNLASVQFALERLNKPAVLTTDPLIIQSASHVILPGVGTAQYAMAQLQTLHLIDVIKQLTQPVLGICLGMQILYASSSEDGNIDCLNIIPGAVTALPHKSGFTLPHMGWNQLQFAQTDSSLLHDITEGSYVYFVHSYAAPVTEHTVMFTHYSQPFTACVNYKNFYGMQFHPERSGKIGAQLLKNFLELS